MQSKRAFWYALSITLLMGFMLMACDQLNPGSEVEPEGASAGKIIVLTIDGGGIKGIIPAYFLSVVEDSLGPCHQLFDVIGGTSTGGIISLGLSSPIPSKGRPFSAHELDSIYANDCSQIFVEHGEGEFGPIYYANHEGEGVEPFLQNILSDTLTLKSAKALMGSSKLKQVFTTSYVVNSNGATVDKPKFGIDYGPYLFNWQDATDSSARNYCVWEAARATSAAPVYFPLANVGGGTSPRSSAKEKWAIDGGTMSNDPAIWGVTESLRTGLAHSLSDIIVISLGVGLDPYDAGVGITNEEGDEGFWGYHTWQDADLYNLKGVEFGADERLLSIMAYANQLATHSQMNAMSSSKAQDGLTYIRLQMPLPKRFTAMDNCTIADSLKILAENYIKPGANGHAVMTEILQTLEAQQLIQ